MFSIAEVQTKVINCNSANKSSLLEVVYTKAIAALTQFCDFSDVFDKMSMRAQTRYSDHILHRHTIKEERSFDGSNQGGRMAFLRKIFSFGGCRRHETDDTHEESSDEASDDDNGNDDRDLFNKPTTLATEMDYVPGVWNSPSLGRRMVEGVRASPKAVRAAMSRMTVMTSPLGQRKKEKEKDEIFIVTMNVVHSSHTVEIGSGKSDAW